MITRINDFNNITMILIAGDSFGDRVSRNERNVSIRNLMQNEYYKY